MGAKTSCKRVRLILGFGTRAARRARKSKGSKITWVVPSCQVFGVVGLTAQTQETEFEAAAFEVIFELALDILR